MLVRNTLPILRCVTLSFFMVGCERAPSKSQVAGTYSGNLNGASEILVLHPDGTVSQELTLPSGEKVLGNGTWRLDYRAVTIDKYQKFYDEMKNGALVPPQEVYGTIYVWGGDMLVRDWGSGYYTLKHE
jgi:hypothetical protein